jgi:hypothetical protein
LGVIVALVFVILRAGTAEAALPATGFVYPAWNAPGSNRFNFADLPLSTHTYSIKFRGKRRTVATDLTGISIIDVLKAGGVDPTVVPFVRVRVNSVRSTQTDDSQLALIPLGLDNPDTPPMVISKWIGPNGPLPSPAIAPPQVSSNGLSQAQIFPFDPRGQELTFIPAKPGAQIMAVQIRMRRTSNGQYRLIASVSGGSGNGRLLYRWFTSDGLRASGSVFTTTDVTAGPHNHLVNVVVSSPSTGSFGANSFAYNSRNPNDGN